MTTLEKAARAMLRDIGNGEMLDSGDPYRRIITIQLSSADLLGMAEAAISAALLDPSDEVVEQAARASYERYQFLCGPAFRPWDEIPTTSREIYVEAQRSALRAAGVKITGKD